MRLDYSARSHKYCSGPEHRLEIPDTISSDIYSGPCLKGHSLDMTPL